MTSSNQEKYIVGLSILLATKNSYNTIIKHITCSQTLNIDKKMKQPHKKVFNRNFYTYIICLLYPKMMG